MPSLNRLRAPQAPAWQPHSWPDRPFYDLSRSAADPSTDDLLVFGRGRKSADGEAADTLAVCGLFNVRFTPESDREADMSRSPKSAANSGLMHRNKFVLFAT